MKLRHLLELIIPQESAIVVLGLTIPPRCGYCHRRFDANDIVMISAARGCGYHLQCQAALDRSTMN